MMAIRTALGTALLIVALTSVRPGIAQQPAFDTASVLINSDPGRPGTKGTTMAVNPSGIVFTEVSLANVLEAAYDVTPPQIKGPSWLRRDRYDIIARSAATASRDQTMAMLQTLLADRFKLTLHRERQDFRAFALVAHHLTEGQGGNRTIGVGKNTKELRLTPGEQGGAARTTRVPEGIAFENTSMSDFARYLSRVASIGLPVVDQTGIEGRFNFTLRLFQGVGKGAGDSVVEEGKKAIVEGGATIFMDALSELGLKLEGRKLPMDVLVVDHAEQVPTPN